MLSTFEVNDFIERRNKIRRPVKRNFVVRDAREDEVGTPVCDYPLSFRPTFRFATRDVVFKRV